MSTPEAAVGFDALLVLRTLKWYSFLAISPSINYLLWCTRPARPHPRLPPPRGWGLGPSSARPKAQLHGGPQRRRRASRPRAPAASRNLPATRQAGSLHPAVAEINLRRRSPGSKDRDSADAYSRTPGRSSAPAPPSPCQAADSRSSGASRAVFWGNRSSRLALKGKLETVRQRDRACTSCCRSTFTAH